MKSYTDIEQSKKLAKILPLESADMTYTPIMDIDSMTNSGFLNIPDCYPFNEFKDCNIKPLPCWSLAALLNVLPKIYYPIKDHKTDLILGKPKDKWCVLYWDTTGMQHGEETLGDNPVDACVDMIVKLKERNLI